MRVTSLRMCSAASTTPSKTGLAVAWALAGCVRAHRRVSHLSGRRDKPSRKEKATHDRLGRLDELVDLVQDRLERGLEALVVVRDCAQAIHTDQPLSSSEEIRRNGRSAIGHARCLIVFWRRSWRLEIWACDAEMRW